MDIAISEVRAHFTVGLKRVKRVFAGQGSAMFSIESLDLRSVFFVGYFHRVFTETVCVVFRTLDKDRSGILDTGSDY